MVPQHPSPGSISHGSRLRTSLTALSCETSLVHIIAAINRGTQTLHARAALAAEQELDESMVDYDGRDGGGAGRHTHAVTRYARTPARHVTESPESVQAHATADTAGPADGQPRARSRPNRPTEQPRVQRDEDPVWDSALFAQQLEALGERVLAARQSRGWSQRGLGDRAEIDRSIVSRIERGNKNITLEVVWRVANTLRVHVADLLDDRLVDLPESVSTSLPFTQQLSVVGRRAYEARVLLRISRQALAERIGLGTSTIAWIEDESRNLTLKTLSRLAAGLNMHWADLLDDRPANPQHPDPRQRDGAHELLLDEAATELAHDFDRHDRPRLARMSTQQLLRHLDARGVLSDYVDQVWRDAHRRNPTQPATTSVAALRGLTQHLVATALDEWMRRPDTLHTKPGASLHRSIRSS